MPRFSLCIEMCFKEEPQFPKRLALAKAAGFETVEFWGLGNKDVDAIAQARKDAGVVISLFGLKLPKTLIEGNDKAAIAQAVEGHLQADDKLGGVRRWVLTTGNTLPDAPRDRQRQSIIDDLKRVAEAVDGKGVTICLEPLNSLVDHKGYFLDHTSDALSILEAVNHPQIKMLHDIYHMQIMEGNLIQTIKAALPRIGHFHTADVPGRYEPGTGEINYGNVFKAIDDLGYGGYVGLEFRPSDNSQAACKRFWERCAGLKR
ncbi:MAG: TIM barrel protein [Candidatus Sumerlaeota bacterium]|nr:TIM barrel protein [Candidatus Sumerlaeota bacterium]